MTHSLPETSELKKMQSFFKTLLQPKEPALVYSDVSDSESEAEGETRDITVEHKKILAGGDEKSHYEAPKPWTIRKPHYDKPLPLPKVSPQLGNEDRESPFQPTMTGIPELSTPGTQHRRESRSRDLPSEVQTYTIIPPPEAILGTSLDSDKEKQQKNAVLEEGTYLNYEDTKESGLVEEGSSLPALSLVDDTIRVVKFQIANAQADEANLFEEETPSIKAMEFYETRVADRHLGQERTFDGFVFANSSHPIIGADVTMESSGHNSLLEGTSLEGSGSPCAEETPSIRAMDTIESLVADGGFPREVHFDSQAEQGTVGDVSAAIDASAGTSVAESREDMTGELKHIDSSWLEGPSSLDHLLERESAASGSDAIAKAADSELDMSFSASEQDLGKHSDEENVSDASSIHESEQDGMSHETAEQFNDEGWSTARSKKFSQKKPFQVPGVNADKTSGSVRKLDVPSATVERLEVALAEAAQTATERKADKELIVMTEAEEIGVLPLVEEGQSALNDSTLAQISRVALLSSTVSVLSKTAHHIRSVEAEMNLNAKYRENFEHVHRELLHKVPVYDGQVDQLLNSSKDTFSRVLLELQSRVPVYDEDTEMAVKRSERKDHFQQVLRELLYKVPRYEGPEDAKKNLAFKEGFDRVLLELQYKIPIYDEDAPQVRIDFNHVLDELCRTIPRYSPDYDAFVSTAGRKRSSIDMIDQEEALVELMKKTPRITDVQYTLEEVVIPDQPIDHSPSRTGIAGVGAVLAAESAMIEREIRPVHGTPLLDAEHDLENLDGETAHISEQIEIEEPETDVLNEREVPVAKAAVSAYDFIDEGILPIKDGTGKKATSIHKDLPKATEMDDENELTLDMDMTAADDVEDDKDAEKSTEYRFKEEVAATKDMQRSSGRAIERVDMVEKDETSTAEVGSGNGAGAPSASSAKTQSEQDSKKKKKHKNRKKNKTKDNKQSEEPTKVYSSGDSENIATSAAKASNVDTATETSENKTSEQPAFVHGQTKTSENKTSEQPAFVHGQTDQFTTSVLVTPHVERVILAESEVDLSKTAKGTPDEKESPFQKSSNEAEDKSTGLEDEGVAAVGAGGSGSSTSSDKQSRKNKKTTKSQAFKRNQKERAKTSTVLITSERESSARTGMKPAESERLNSEDTNKVSTTQGSESKSWAEERYEQYLAEGTQSVQSRKDSAPTPGIVVEEFDLEKFERKEDVELFLLCDEALVALDVSRDLKGDKDQHDRSYDWMFWSRLVAKIRQNPYSEAVQKLKPSVVEHVVNGQYAGVPNKARKVIWMCLSDNHVPNGMLENQDSSEGRSVSQIVLDQVQVDVGRTYPQASEYDSKRSKLKGVLEAYALQDPAVGYCSALALVAGVLTLELEEAQSLTLLKRMMYHYDLRRQYMFGLEGSRMRTYQFEKLLERFSPDLAKHLDEIDCPSDLIVGRWFSTCFAYRAPLELVYQKYDLFLLEGQQALFKLALAFYTENKNELMSAQSKAEALDFLSNHVLDVHGSDYRKWLESAGQFDISSEHLENLACSFRTMSRHSQALGVAGHLSTAQTEHQYLASQVRHLASQLDTLMLDQSRYMRENAELRLRLMNLVEENYRLGASLYEERAERARDLAVGEMEVQHLVALFKHRIETLEKKIDDRM